MNTPDQFDKTRNSYESWPWLFGHQLDRIHEANGRAAPIDELTLLTHDLFQLASIHMAKEAVLEGELLMEKGGKPEALMRLRILSLQAAHAAKTWVFRDETPKDEEDLETLLEKRRAKLPHR